MEQPLGPVKQWGTRCNGGVYKGSTEANSPFLLAQATGIQGTQRFSSSMPLSTIGESCDWGKLCPLRLDGGICASEMEVGWHCPVLC